MGHEVPDLRDHRKQLKLGIARGQERPLVKMQLQLQWKPQDSGATRTIGCPQGQWQVWSGISQSLTD